MPSLGGTRASESPSLSPFHAHSASGEARDPRRSSLRWTALLARLALALLAPNAIAGPEELVQAERDFASAVAAEGIKPAFLRFLAEDGLLLRPGPVRATDHFARSPDDPGLLEWAPAYVRLSRGGDLGFTYGPWRYRASRTNTEINATGQYLTVWKRTPSGWRAALDAGIGSPAQAFPWEVERDGPRDPDDSLPSWQQSQRERDLRYVEETYGRRAAREGEAKAMEAQGHKWVRVLRQGALPVVGRSEATRFLASNRRLTRDQLQGFLVSGSGDLGYAWGVSELLGSGTTPALPVRSWVRIWQRSGWSGTWRVAVDLALDHPEPAP